MLLCLGFFAVPLSCLADAGTPLVWATAFHLFIGNALIGVVEGLILAKFFSLKKRKTVLLLVAANYFSAWMGALFLGGPVVRFLHTDLYNGWRWFWILVFATYFMTLFLEWPFVAFCFRGDPHWIKRSLKGNLLVQSLSYAVLFSWYWMASGATLYTQTHVVSAKEIAVPESVLVYYISDQDGDVYSQKLSTGETRKVFALKSTNENDRLIVHKGSSNNNCWSLAARLETSDPNSAKFVQIIKCIDGQAALDSRAAHDPSTEVGTWMNFGEVPRLAGEDATNWKFQTGFWPVEGLYGKSKGDGATAHISFETPFAAWSIRNATQLPKDQVVFQFSSDQICLFDPETKQIALLAHGRGPVVVLADKTAP